MSVKSWQGRISGEVIDVRFAFSSTVSKVSVGYGDNVKANQILAALDRKLFQNELDKELADYERVRAQFEVYVAKQGEPQTDIAKFEKIQIQSLLTASVKAVELAHLRLDQTHLLSPVTGQVLSTGGLRPGLHVTPSSHPFQLLDSASLVFLFEVDWADISLFPLNQPVRVRLEGISESIPAQLLPFVPPLSGKSPAFRARLSDSSSINLGCPGILTFE